MTAAVLALLCIGRLLLLLLPVKWSQADETAQARLALATTEPGYRYSDACRAWLADPDNAKWPGMARFVNVLGVGALYRVLRLNTYQVPAAVSAAAGCVTVVAAWVLASALHLPRPLLAAALVATSPLGMHLGRRALQDSGVAALTLAAAALLATGHPVAAAVTLAVLVGYKETALLVFPAVGAFGLTVGLNPDMVAGVLAGAGALYWLAFAALTGDGLAPWRFFRFGLGATRDAYGDEQRGGPLRLVVDLVMLSPIVVAAKFAPPIRPAASFVSALLLVYGFTPIMQSVRMVLAADLMLRVAFVGCAPPVMALVCFGADALIFYDVFHKARVYDPITRNLVRALGMSARD